MAADDDERTEEPTQRKLQQARERGDIIYSAEVGTALSLLAVTGIVAFMSGPILAQTAHGFIADRETRQAEDAPDVDHRRKCYAAMIKIAGIFSLAGLALGGAA